ncbi:hypothetical protein WI61_29300 [Burkholderia cepacia]|nr:hypothetical protein WI47_25735 [Burkholderia cepacia]KVA52658.1 hypothetical protein WI48_02200 [Burkholderia cepacia]KVA70901.1 hypothetical protein WI49_35235 [Burkholderia cepacia]KVA82684.1 hypothetical protein WI50_21785 [Burkholderia cepacia]KVA83024.1 hypothetical protein WI52_18200 [Burkholderia cepacia]
MADVVRLPETDRKGVRGIRQDETPGGEILAIGVHLAGKHAFDYAVYEREVRITVIKEIFDSMEMEIQKSFHGNNGLGMA